MQKWKNAPKTFEILQINTFTQIDMKSKKHATCKLEMKKRKGMELKKHTQRHATTCNILMRQKNHMPKPCNFFTCNNGFKTDLRVIFNNCFLTGITAF